MYIKIGENLFMYTKICGIQQPEIYSRLTRYGTMHISTIFSELVSVNGNDVH